MALIRSGPVVCPACSALDGTCTSPGHRDDHDVIELTTEEYVMSDTEKKELKVYEVVYNGFKTRMKLSDADAKRLGGKPVGGESASPQGKARTAPNK